MSGLPPTPELPQEAWFNPASQYTPRDIGITTYAEWEICKEMFRRLSPYVDMHNIYSGLRIEFNDFETDELKQYHAIGLSDRNRNVILKSSNVGFFDLVVDSGIMSMEAYHTILYRLTNDRILMNDVCHYLYNAGKLVTVKVQNDIYNRWLGGRDMQFVIPDVVYGWINRQEIMNEIRSGTAPIGNNVYWSVINPNLPVVPAEFHERLHIQEFLAKEGVI